jgi:uncharacterized protein (DUF983 family)
MASFADSKSADGKSVAGPAQLALDGAPRRDTWTAVRRGFLGRCPNCGEGRLFGRYLKAVECCGHCGERLDLHRADDLPAYLVILIVGHIVVGAMIAFEAFGDAPVWQQMLVWPGLTLILALLLLQPTKGAVIGLQWALRMHGFGVPHPLEHDEKMTEAR